MKYFTNEEEKEIIILIKKLTTDKILFNNREDIIDIYSTQYEMSLKELISKNYTINNYSLINFNKFVTCKYTLNIEEFCSKNVMNKIKKGIPYNEVKNWSQIINIKELHINENEQILYNIIDSLLEEYITTTNLIYYGLNLNKLIERGKIIFYSCYDEGTI